ncbi:MAG: maleylpyruvate isomerase family mycothiol-dependent enzyme [Chloroflexota bacterium]
MATSPDIDHCLTLIRRESARTVALLDSLDTARWQQTSNCPPWTVRDLAAHVISGGTTFRVAVEQGVAGSVVQAISEHQRDQLMAEITANGPAGAARALEQATDAFEKTYQSLTSAQLDAICFHRRGNRPARWYVRHRLAEMAFHHLDLDRSTGGQADFPRDVAEALLPTLFESNMPRTHHLGPRGTGRVRVVDSNNPAASWVLDATPESLTVKTGDSDAQAQILAPAEDLAMISYGRLTVAQAEASGRARLSGDRDLALRWHQIFATP